MIIMSMGSVFALFSNSIVLDSFINQCQDSNDPLCGTGTTIFGGEEKGTSETKTSTFSDPIQMDHSRAKSIQKWAGLGDPGGNTLLETQTTKPENQQVRKTNFVFFISKNGQITYQEKIISVADFKNLIEKTSIGQGIYLEAVVDQYTSYSVYKKIKKQLWDLTDAENWRAIVMNPETKSAILKSIKKYGTTYHQSVGLSESPSDILSPPLSKNTTLRALDELQ
tara:strand:- start:6222 stop:6893 length:672 start_codon:yes stop_codon:yes gene_type:complete